MGVKCTDHEDSRANLPTIKHPEKTKKIYVCVYYVFKGADTTNVKLADARILLSDTLRDFMYSTGVDNGLAALGYQFEDIPALVTRNFASTSCDKAGPIRDPWGGGTCEAF